MDVLSPNPSWMSQQEALFVSLAEQSSLFMEAKADT